VSKKIVLYSGGFDSTSLLFKLIKEDKINPEDIIALNIYYGQRNYPEIAVAKYFTDKLGITRDEIDISTIADKIFEVSSLVNKDIEVDSEEKLEKNKQPNTYVPNRNMIFISIAAAYAESVDAHDIYTAIQPHSKYYYWDTTNMFIDALNTLFRINPYKISIHAPFSNLSKKYIYQHMLNIGVDPDELAISWSCYNPVIEDYDDYMICKPCNVCGSCLERNEFLPQKPIKINKQTLELI